MSDQKKPPVTASPCDVIALDPVSRFEHRCLLERSRMLASQIIRGRLPPFWRRCTTPACGSSSCLYGEPSYMLVDEAKSKDGVPVAQYHLDFHQTVAAQIWELHDGLNEYQKVQAIASFAGSVPVRQVLGKLSHYVECLEPPLLQAELFHELVKVANTLWSLIAERQSEEQTQDLIHRYMGLEVAEMEKHRGRLYDHLLASAIEMEQWRQYGMVFRPLWSFSGHPWIVAQLHVGILLHFFNLDKEGCFKLVTKCLDYERDKIWEEWFKQFPLPGPLRTEDEEILVMSHGNKKGAGVSQDDWSGINSAGEGNQIVNYLEGIGQGACTSIYEKVPAPLRRLVMEHLLSRREIEQGWENGMCMKRMTAISGDGTD